MRVGARDDKGAGDDGGVRGRERLRRHHFRGKPPPAEGVSASNGAVYDLELMIFSLRLRRWEEKVFCQGRLL